MGLWMVDQDGGGEGGAVSTSGRRWGGGGGCIQVGAGMHGGQEGWREGGRTA